MRSPPAHSVSYSGLVSYARAAPSADRRSQRLDPVRPLPRQVEVRAPEVSVRGGRLVDRPAQVECSMIAAGRRSKCRRTSSSSCSLGDRRRCRTSRRRSRSGAPRRSRTRPGPRSDRPGLPRRCSWPRSAPRRPPERSTLLGSLPLNAPPPCAGHAAVGVDDDLAAGEARVARRAADDEPAGRVDEVACVLSSSRWPRGPGR